MLETFTCSLCGEELPFADAISFSGRRLCHSCYEEETVICDHCGERIWQEDNCGDDFYTLCRDCEHIYIKHDGSLDDGLEIVTHPMTLSYHMSEMPWQAVIAKARQLGYTSHQSGTCGLHVHVNRSSLGDTYQQQDDTSARILFLVETFWHELLRFSRRTQSQLNRWAARYGRKDEPKDVLKSAEGSYNRYTCVNLVPHSTIEFRLFRGTLKYNTIIATL